MDFIVDILVMGATFSEHLENLHYVLENPREAGLYLKPSKCHMGKREVEYRGYVVSAGGVAANQRKVQVVQEFLVPPNVKLLRSFLGLASYYCWLNQNSAIVATPFLHSSQKVPIFVKHRLPGSL